jgi:outer membrane protein assembly factor BamD
MRRAWVAVLFCLLWGCGKKNVEVDIPSGIREPDRVLYDQAIRDLKKSRYNVARITLQTLISTYPDSEFLPEAKYAMAESFYREGTTSNLNQAEIEFKDFITFFPISERAADAQMMIAMTHIRQMEKPDRDPSQAVLAETELINMIQTYPDSSLLEEAKQKLRAVQEVLAEGEFKIGNQYFIRRAYRAAISRYRELTEKYPDFSKMPDVLYNLAEALRESDNQESAIWYDKIIVEYPFSDHVAEAKAQLVVMNRPIPEPSPAAVARGPLRKEDKGLFGRVLGGFVHHPPVPTDTGASSVSGDKQTPDKSEEKPKDGDSGIGGTFKIENKPAKKPK